MGFSLIIAVWLFVASSCVTMGGVHLLIWIRERSRSSLWFSISAFSNAALGVFELGLMRSKSPAVYGELIRWGHVPLFLMLAALVLLVRSFSGAGRLWLAASTIAARGVSSIVVNFLHSPNLNFSEITGVRQVTFLGEFVSVAVGRVSPWTRVGEAASLVLLVFLVDATATAWRRRRRKALFVAGSAIVFVLIAVINSSLFVHGPAGPQRPYLISVPYFVILLAMGYELSSDLLRAADLARRLDSSEERLLESDRRLALAAEAVDLGFWTWDARADEMWMTATGRELRGFARDERLNLSRFLSSVDREDREAIRQTIEVAGAKGIAFEREYRIVRPDGEIRWVFLRGRGERDAGGGSARVRGASVDVTSRRAEQAEARRHEAELAHLSRVTVLGELSGSLAHELNQPLTAILANAQAAQRFLARDGAGAGEMPEILADIVQEGKRAGEVIRRLRRLLKRGEVHAEPLDLAELLEGVLKLVRSDLLARGVSISVDLEPGLPKALGDRVQVEQVVLNLVSNACDAMAGLEAGERRLTLRLARGENGDVAMSVVDRGPGIAGSADRLFEPFVTTKAEGLGLGLAVCRSIVSAHGGRLWAANNADRGATFHFTLPVAGDGP